jgi:putative transport protein
MEIDILDLMSKNRTLLTFAVIGIGYLIGGLKVGGIQVGATTGVLLAGLFMGHLGVAGTAEAATFGFTIFIFCVGLEAGPSFFSVFLTDGRKYIVLSLIVAATAIGLSLLFSGMLGLDYGMTAGLLAGALTSTPTLAGAQDAITSGLAHFPAGMTAAQAGSNVSVAYAITYIFGTAGLIIFVRYFPVIFRIDLPAEARKLAEQRGALREFWQRRQRRRQLPLIRAYRVPEGGEIVGKRLEQVVVEREKRFTPLKVRRGTQILEPDPELVIEVGDVVSLVARLTDFEEIQDRVGSEVLDPELLDYQITTAEIVVITSEMIGKPMRELHIPADYGCFPVGITRASIDLGVEEGTALNKGDRLHIVGEMDRIKRLAEHIGYIEEEVTETDLLTFSFGIVAGILLGMILWKVGNLSLGLGSAGGLLLTGILIGYLRSLHPTFGRVPAAARHILMEIGLMLFMATIGLRAGGGVVEAFTSVGPLLILAGIAVTIIPVLVAYAFGRYVLQLNPAVLLGSITGAMTSTPSLSVVTEAARSNVPALGYAGTYTFANVFLTFAGTLLMML